MTVYEFYLHDKEKGDKLIGVLPERRNKRERVSHESIMNWIRMIYNDADHANKIFYIQVKL